MIDVLVFVKCVSNKFGNDHQMSMTKNTRCLENVIHFVSSTCGKSFTTLMDELTVFLIKNESNSYLVDKSQNEFFSTIQT